MRFEEPLVRARFLRRPNRFAVEVEIEGRRARAHLPNSGRLGELLRPENPLYLAPRPASHRKTPYDVALARCGRELVSVDARLPNRLAAEAALAGRLREFEGYESLEREVPYRGSRLDLAFTGPGPRRCLVEVKSVTLVEANRALFPDAPTARGLRHLQALEGALDEEEAGALVLFVVQRSDARTFRPNDAADPAFAQALRRAAGRGVKVSAYTCYVSTRSVSIDKPIPVEI